jgi:hypothetical protein
MEAWLEATRIAIGPAFYRILYLLFRSYSVLIDMSVYTI